MPSLLLYFLMLELSLGNVQARILRLSSSDDLISDGVDLVSNQPPFLTWAGSSLQSCYHTYGFFPCADNIGGYIFQIVVYQYLLIIGGKLVTKGSKTLFNILGTGVYGASVFRILMVLPKLVMVIVSGVLQSKETAQYTVSYGVGVYAGSTVFNLTLLWGMCVIFGRTELSAKSASKQTRSSVSKCLLAKEKLSDLKDTGVTIDKKTCYTAGIMLLSLIPYILVQLANVFNTSFGTRLVILIALVLSTLLLLSYFVYQIFDPWIQERSLEYSKYENLLAGFLQHVQRHAQEKLIDENGQPNVPVIKRLFAQTDKDDDKCITFLELENLIQDIQNGKVQVDKDYAISEILKVFDLNKDGRIEEHEFVEGCTKWINEAKQLAESGESTSRKFLREVVQPFSKNKGNVLTEVEHLMARILKHAQSQALEGKYLLLDDGSPDSDRIKDLFNKFDTDKSNSITKSEMEQLIHTVKFGDMQLDRDGVVEKVMKDFDRDGDNIIDEEEFVDGVTKWLKKAINVTKCKDAKNSIDEFDKIMWGEVDNLVYDVKQNGSSKFKSMTWAFSKSVFQVILGIAVLTFLSGPLMTSVQQISDAIGIPSFFISFVIVPAAMNARTAILAIFPASQKSSRTASLTFSEIYGGVVMNNLMGLTTLLLIVYAKDLTWSYSAEVLTILMVCGVIGSNGILIHYLPIMDLFIGIFPLSIFLGTILCSSVSFGLGVSPFYVF
ncbi:sodium/calcium exchanger family protein/calcium-binding EF hand family protein [Abeliophyllum distichum]|uniref:Sodium/calcium exchanger family protein/calcium-binding EF hand family protein n=1 Tax=Abeliophyllum distichum TaxID=126358 RepID=A0ABD1UIC4_9LAMI